MKRGKERKGIKPLRLCSCAFSSIFRLWTAVSGFVAGVGSGVGGATVFLTDFFAGGAAAEEGTFLLLVPAFEGAGAASSAYMQASFRGGLS